MRDGQAGLGHPPWRGGGAEVCLQKGVRVFLKGSERGAQTRTVSSAIPCSIVTAVFSQHNAPSTIDES